MLIYFQYLAMDFSQQMTIIRESMAGRRSKETKVRFISPEKWRNIMRKCLQKFKGKHLYDNNMIEDLDFILTRIPEDSFVEATLNLQPFKPVFAARSACHRKASPRLSSESDDEETGFTGGTKLEQSPPCFKNSIVKLKHSVCEKLECEEWESKEGKQRRLVLDELLVLVTEEQTLVREFEAKYHPFRRIIEQFLFLVESKYGMVIEAQGTVEVELVQERLIIDLRLLQEFIVKGSEPYLQLFKTDNIEEHELYRLKLIVFIRNYLEKHERINLTIRKIMRAATRKSSLIRTLAAQLPDFATIHDFSVPPAFQIDGCYAHAMTTLVSLCECTSSTASLRKLRELRLSLGKDLDSFYREQGKEGQRRELSAETQLEIVKFLVGKLKAFLVEIFAQLKYLEVVCGEGDMSYKFDDSSYMYAQLSVAFEALELDLQQTRP